MSSFLTGIYERPIVIAASLDGFADDANVAKVEQPAPAFESTAVNADFRTNSMAAHPAVAEYLNMIRQGQRPS